MGRKARLKRWPGAWTMLSRGFLALPLVLLTVTAGSESGVFSEFRFTVEPHDVVVERDRPAVLDCSAFHDTAQPVIQWLRDGVLLERDSRRYTLPNGSLYFDAIDHTKTHRPDEGTYQCLASVPQLGSIVSSLAQLTVGYLEKAFYDEPHDVSVYLGDTAMFPCLIGGQPKPEVRWYKNNLELSPSNVNYRFHMDGVLEVTDVRFEDFSRYKCRVETMDRSRDSEDVELTQKSDISSYQGVAPAFIMQPQNRVARQGTTIMLYCGANGRDRQATPPTITWLKDGNTIDMADLDSRFSVVGQGSLRVDALNPDDSGSYTCRATNAEDSVDAVATLTVQVAPFFLRRPRDTAARVNTDVELECEAGGSPRPSMRWLKNGDVINPSDYFQLVEGHHLRILGLLQADAGMYQCVAQNEVGNVQAAAQLVVLEQGNSRASSVERPSRPKNLRAAFLSTRFVTLAWDPPDFSGTSDTSTYGVFFREDGSDRERTVNTTQLEANIQHLKPGTEYQFRVIAYNKAGPSEHPATITITTEREVSVPGPPVNLQAVPLSPTSIRVSWDPPSDPHGAVSSYKLYYYEVGADGEEEVPTLPITAFPLTDLRAHCQYSFRVVALNENGAGVSTEEVMARTFSDVPSDAPQNITVEPVSASSISIHWEPPPEDARNGLITGYKIRYKTKQTGRGERAESFTTDGSVRSYVIEELPRNTHFMVKVAAMTVNGTGPASVWYDVSTYETDLDESMVPGIPTSLHVRPMTESILVSWTPPAEQDIMIRGYILSYGKNVPDVYRAVLDPKLRYHTIKNLEASSEYVIKLLAFNNVGEGRPRYETAFTREVTTPEPMTPMSLPLGVKAAVLSATTVVLTWTDTSLGRNQRINDNRYYSVRYNPKMSRKRKMLNSTDLNAHIDDLKPDTEYEFAVKVIKSQRQSPWSLSTFVRTHEAPPATAPRDLTPIGVEGKTSFVTLNWQPPRQPNGKITGYLVFYTTDATLDDRDWAVQGVVGGDKLSDTISDLSPETTYYFKVQARNNKGYGPSSPTVIFRTPKVDGTGGGMIELPDDYGRQPPYSDASRPGGGPGGGPGGPGANRGQKGGYYDYYDDTSRRGGSQDNRKTESKDAKSGLSPMVLWIIIGCVSGITLIAVIVVTVILCRRRMTDADRKAKRGPGYRPANKSPKGAKPAGPRDLKPPDLWIHHEGMEMKAQGEKGGHHPESTASVSPIPRETQETKSLDEYPTGMDGRRNSFISERQYDAHRVDDRYNRLPVRPKPIMIPVDQPPPPREPIATAIPNGHLGSDGGQGSTPVRPVYPRTQYNTQYSSTPRVNAGDLSQPSSVRPQPQLPAQSPGVHSSPTKGPSTPISPTQIKPRSPRPVGAPRAPEVSVKGTPREEPSDLVKSVSTEQLTAEMANLEGLMKDLNAITQQEFEC